MPSLRQLPNTYMGTEFVDGIAPRDIYVGHGTEQIIASNGHYGYPDFPPDRDVGGTFLKRDDKYDYDIVDVGKVWRGGALNQYYTGAFTAVPQNPGGGITIADGSSRAAEAYKRMKPTKPEFQMLNAAYELRELPGQLRQRFLNQGLKAIPNYWLALQFGWKPLLQDIVNLYYAQQLMEKRLKWLLKHNGKVVRRKVVLTDKVSDLSTSRKTNWFPSIYPILVNQYYASAPENHTTWKYGERWWASARFRYWLPEGPGDINWERAMKARLLGLYPSPSVLWNALPWTWMVDWFTSVGDMLENMDTGVANRLAADCFYMMRDNWFTVETTTLTSFRRQSGEIVPFRSSSLWTRRYMSRVKGDPFGWNTEAKQLNGMQLSIMGALGMSRLR